MTTWHSIKELMKKNKNDITFFNDLAFYFNLEPQRLICELSYYKFASKLFGKPKKVLDIGCKQGLGTYILSKETGFAKGIDFNPSNMNIAQHNYISENIQFEFIKKLEEKVNFWDGIVLLNNEHSIFLNTSTFKQILEYLKQEGLLVIGIKNNHFLFGKLQQFLKQFFEFTFMFYANNEVVQVGNSEFKNYQLAVCSKKVLDS